MKEELRVKVRIANMSVAANEGTTFAAKAGPNREVSIAVYGNHSAGQTTMEENRKVDRLVIWLS